jgi:glycosyltransferase involved in cell wall biosynthesis
MPPRVRICVDLTPLEMLDRHGGFGRYAVELLRALVAIDPPDVELDAVVSSRGPVVPAAEALEAVLGREIASWQHRWQRRLVLGSLLARRDVDLFHATQPRATPWLGGPRLATAHDLVPIVLPEPGADGIAVRAARRAIHRRRYERALHVIAISEQTRADLMHELGIARRAISVVYHGVDEGRFRAEVEPGERERTRAAHELPAKWLLCVSSDHYRKNHRRLLEAWLRVADRVEEGLVFVGRALYEGTLGEVAREVSGRGLGARFRWLEGIGDDALPALYRGATACVAPSRYEGFGMTVLEAMACGTPVLAAANGAYEEVGGAAARYFHPDDPTTLSELLVAVGRDASLRADMAARGRARAATMGWDATAKATLEVYRRLTRRDAWSS